MAHEKGYPRVTVHWDDAFRNSGQQYKADFKKELLKSWPMETIGWLVAEDKDRVGLVQELDRDGDTRSSHSIPRKMITRIEYLEPVQKPTKAKGKKK